VAGRCNASQDTQDAWDAGDASLASGRNADGSDAGSVFADAGYTKIGGKATLSYMPNKSQVRTSPLATLSRSSLSQPPVLA